MVRFFILNPTQVCKTELGFSVVTKIYFDTLFTLYTLRYSLRQFLFFVALSRKTTQFFCYGTFQLQIPDFALRHKSDFFFFIKLILFLDSDGFRLKINFMFIELTINFYIKSKRNWSTF
jgi:hypothetical protein